MASDVIDKKLYRLIDIFIDTIRFDRAQLYIGMSFIFLFFSIWLIAILFPIYQLDSI